MTINGENIVCFDIVEHLGVLNTYPTGWSKELNLVRWNGFDAKYDIRDWDPEHERMSRGVMLNKEEMEHLVNLYLDHEIIDGMKDMNTLEVENFLELEDK